MHSCRCIIFFVLMLCFSFIFVIRIIQNSNLVWIQMNFWIGKRFCKMEKVFRNKNQSWAVFPETILLGPLSFSTRAAWPAPPPLHGVKPSTGPAVWLLTQSLTWMVTKAKVTPTQPGRSQVEANTTIFPLLILSPSITSWSWIWAGIKWSPHRVQARANPL
jgi:hypothetical protein